MTKLSRHQSWRSEQVAGQVDLPFKEEEETTFPEKQKFQREQKERKEKSLNTKSLGRLRVCR